MGNESIKPKFKVGETAYIMRFFEIKKVTITECYNLGNRRYYYCYIPCSKVIVHGISEENIFKKKEGAIISTLLKMECVDIEFIRDGEYKITINETEG